MSDSISPIISASELSKIYKNDQVILVDSSGGPNARATYDEAHITGALFADLENDLAYTKIDPAKGGRHPLPSIHKFSIALTKLGITAESHVVIYDHMSGANAASRFWWMLKAVGHEKVQVLDGGFSAAVDAGLPIDSKPVKAKKVSVYEANDWALSMAKIDEVTQASVEGDQLIIDVRSTERYNGETEPIDLIAGHIPGAVNAPFAENLDGNGLFKSPKQLKKQLTELFGGKKHDEVIVHCGSGVTACHTLLATAYAGLEVPKLYVGSWSEWSRNDKEMVTKD